LFATDDKSAVVAPTCEPPVLEAAAVWSPAIANDVRAKTSSEVMRRFDAMIGGWNAARTVACGLDTPMRARRLACLDGVIVRLDTVRKASVADAKPTLDEVSLQLIDPGVCNVDDPPRLPTKLTDAAVAAFALGYGPAPGADFDETAEAVVLRDVGDDRCARAYARLARAQNDESTKARDAADEALQLADACGDDRARADALVTSLAMQITLFIDPKLQKALAAAEAAVRKVSQPDLVAQLDLIKAAIAGISAKFDEQLKLSESAIRGFGEQRPHSRLEAVRTKVTALQNRRQPGDIKASRAELARWRAEAERQNRPRITLELDMLDVNAQWELGDVAGAAARYPELYDRNEKLREEPLSGGTTISGVVVDAAGKPVAGAVVAAGPVIAADSATIGFMGSIEGVRVATSDTQGAFQLPNVEADAIIVAQHGDQRSRVRRAKDKDKIVLQPTARLSGRVLDREPHQLTVFVLPADRDMSPMYQMLAPIAPDGTFTIERVPIGRVRIGVAHGAGTVGQSFAAQEITVGAKGRSDLAVRRPEDRKLRVLVRSSANVPLSGAQVLVVAGNVSIKTVKEIESLLRSPGLAVEMARALTGETPPELGTLVPGDLVATFTNAPTGVASACAIGLTGDFTDPSFRDKLQKHLDELEVRCVPVGPDAKAATIEVPPMKRID
jgi:hypothetical protein